RHAITMAKALPTSQVEARRTAAWSYALLATAAAKRGDAAATRAILAEEQELATPTSCALGIALDDQRRGFVAVDSAGKASVVFDELRTTTAIEPGKLVPAPIVKSLAGCKEVSVIARPPVHGTSRILPDDIAWKYASRRAEAARPAGTRELVIANVEPPA